MQAQPQDLRGLKALVGILGVLIVLGTALVVGVVIRRIYARQAAPSIMVALPALAATLPAGEHITGIAAAGAQLAVWVEGPDGGKVLLLNPGSGALSVALTAPK